jgi:hypothetical protein
MNTSPIRPTSITILAVLILVYALGVIGWDMVTPFEREYAQGPATVLFGLRVYGLLAQVVHGVQLFIALALVSGLWAMRVWGWQLVLFVVGYILISTTVWVIVYQEFGRIMFAFLNLMIVNILLMLTFPHREKFE